MVAWIVWLIVAAVLGVAELVTSRSRSASRGRRLVAAGVAAAHMACPFS